MAAYASVLLGFLLVFSDTSTVSRPHSAYTNTYCYIKWHMSEACILHYHKSFRRIDAGSKVKHIHAWLLQHAVATVLSVGTSTWNHLCAAAMSLRGATLRVRWSCGAVLRGVPHLPEEVQTRRQLDSDQQAILFHGFVLLTRITNCSRDQLLVFLHVKIALHEQLGI